MPLIKAIFLAFCMISFFFGFLTYSTMFPQFGPELWLFIPDCPLYVALLLLIAVFGIKNELFRFIAAAGLVKYGMWTLMIFSLYPEVYLSERLVLQTGILIIGHILMVLASLAIVPKKPGIKALAPALAWFLINDYMDYWVGTMPVFPSSHLEFVVVASIALSIVSVVVLTLLNGLRELEIFRWLRRELGVPE